MTAAELALISMGREFQSMLDARTPVFQIAARAECSEDFVREALALAAQFPAVAVPTAPKPIEDERIYLRPKWTYPDATTLKIAHAVREEIRAADVGAMSRIANV